MADDKNPSDAQAFGDFLEAREEARYKENQEILRKLRAIRSVARQQKETLEEVKGRLALYERLAEEQLDPPEWIVRLPKKEAHQGIPSAVIGDIHFDEVVDPATVGGINAYNRDISILRVQRAFERCIVVSREYLKGLEYPGIQLFFTGDMLSGNIHDELRETNESTLADAVLSLVEPLESGINLLAEEFGKVNVACVVGNHPRATRRKRYKRQVKDNMDWMLYQLIARDFEDSDEVTVSVSEAPDLMVPIYNTRYLLTHGDQFRGGSGIAGALSPLMLGVYRKQKRAAAAGNPFDVLVCGHWHQNMSLPSRGLIVSGSVKGYDEYAYTKNLPPEPPQCAFWVTTPEHGVTFQAPLFVADREAEGW